MLDISGNWNGPDGLIWTITQIKNTAPDVENWAAWFTWTCEHSDGVLETSVGRFTGPSTVEACWNRSGGSLDAPDRNGVGTLIVSGGKVIRINWVDDFIVGGVRTSKKAYFWR